MRCGRPEFRWAWVIRSLTAVIDRAVDVGRAAIGPLFFIGPLVCAFAKLRLARPRRLTCAVAGACASAGDRRRHPHDEPSHRDCSQCSPAARARHARSGEPMSPTNSTQIRYCDCEASHSGADIILQLRYARTVTVATAGRVMTNRRIALGLRRSRPCVLLVYPSAMCEQLP